MNAIARCLLVFARAVSPVCGGASVLAATCVRVESLCLLGEPVSRSLYSPAWEGGVDHRTAVTAI